MDSPNPPIFPRLASGPRKMEPEAVARHQRGRLEGAMVDSVARHGYEGTTLRELVSVAGVSKSTFYEHFSCKQECFLDTYDDIVDEIARRIDRAYKARDSLHDRLIAGLATLMDTAAEDKEAAYLVVVESLTLGEAGVEHRDRASERFESFIWDGFERSGATEHLSGLAVRGIVAGIRNSAYQRLRRGESSELPEVVEPIVGWIERYSKPPGARARRAAEVAAIPAPPAPHARHADDHTPDWDDPPDSPGSRAALSQRERIIRAAARVGVEKGYASLSIPSISTAAGVSNQTFYDHFPGKREAFVAAFDALAAEALRHVAAAFEAQPGRPDAVGAGLRALLEHIAEDDLFARLAFFELPAAGPPALDLADRVLGGFTGFLGPNDRADVPKVVQESLGGGIWAVIQHEIVAGRVAGLPELAPQITEFVMGPFHPPDEPGTPG